IHYRGILLSVMERQHGLKYRLSARCTSINDLGVTYVDRDGLEHKLEAQTVILAVGMKPKTAEAMKFAKSLVEAGIGFRLIGDCAHSRGNIQRAVRSAFAAASAI
ncbi:MAG: hypothetical protein QXN87_07670, partial [Candidatus Bathyarchaeia archaeon]